MHHHRQHKGRRMERTHSRILEERMGDGPVQVAAGASDSYNHADIVAKLCRARYCSRGDYAQIRGTSGRDELIDLGNQIKDENPMLATDIFTHTGYEEGIEEMKPRLFNSTDEQELSFASYWARGQGKKVYKEYCEALLRNALQLQETDPKTAADLRQRYERMRRASPTPLKGIKVVRVDKKTRS